LSNVGDVDDMAQNAITLLKDQDLHTAFRKNALLQAHKFDLKEILLQYEAIYNRVTQNL
jgi:glycosyltransferase involved in cell wall biosynthesis